MNLNIKPFEEPIYVTRPLLPGLEEVNKKLQQIWDAKWLTNNGAQHQQLEAAITKRLGVPYTSLFNNGTIALLVATRTLDLSGEVITTPFSFAATTHILEWANIKPVFCDIEPDTMNMDPKKIESLITEKTSAILPVHVFGTPCKVKEIDEMAGKHNLKVLYDAAHAFGVEVDNKGIGNYGDASALSFHATKMFHSVEGGALLFKDEKLKIKTDLLKNFGIKNEEEVVMSGINGKMNELQAAIGLIVLEHLDEERSKRKALVELYKKLLSDIEGISFLSDLPNVKSNYQYFVIQIDEEKFGKSRNFVYDKLKEFNVFTRKYFYPLISNFSVYNQLTSAKKENLPVANKVVNNVLSMPLYGELRLEDVEKICLILKELKIS